MQDDSIFLGIILDVFSQSNLQPLNNAFKDKVTRNGFDKVRRTYHAHFELPWSQQRRPTPSSIILKFCKLIRSLPTAERRLWDAAKFKSFDIGLDEPGKGRGYWGFVSAEAVQAAAEVGARIAFTVYGPPMKFAAAPVKRNRRSIKPK